MAQAAAWRVQGQVLIACNCDYGCPCNMNALPTHGDCEGGWTWQIEQGAVTHDRVRYDHSGKYAGTGYFQYVGP